VIDRPTQAMARSMASASATRYPVNDGHNRSVEIDVSLACQLGCTDASPTDSKYCAPDGFGISTIETTVAPEPVTA